MFWHSLERHARRPALHGPETETVSYAELIERADGFRRRLGERRGLVLLSADNSPETIAAYLGALRGGHAVLLAEGTNRALIANLVRTYRPDATYAREDGRWELTRSPSGEELHPDLALVLSTSGSTGSAKCVRLSRANLQANAEAIIEYLGVAPSDRTPLTLPLHYCYGLSVLHTHLATGASVFCGEHTMASSDFVAFLRSERITSFAGVPYSFELLERHGFRFEDLPDLRYVTQAGGRLAPALVAEYARWAIRSGKEFFVMYGQTEATARMAYMPSRVAQDHPSCIGGPIPGGRFHLRNDAEEVIDRPDVAGELVYTGPNVMMGYARSRRDLARGTDSTSLATGDIACRNRAGLYTIVGRANRFAKIFGRRLNLADAERLLEEAGAAAVCVSDDQRLYALLPEGGDTTAAAERLCATYDLPPDRVRAVPFGELPRMPSGKIDYEAARATAIEMDSAAEEATAPASTDPDAKRQRLRRLYADAFRKGPVRTTDSFADLGGDSLRYVQISIGIDEILGTVPEGWEAKTIDELAGEARTAPRKGATLESGVPLRALAILFIVAHHAGLAVLAGGAQLLLMASGLYFVRFQGRALARGRILPVLGNCARNFLIPYLGVVVCYQVLKRHLYLPDLLLVDNFVDPRAARPFPTWFMQALLQSVVLFSLPFAVPALRRKWNAHGFPYAMALLAFGTGLRMLDGALDFGVVHGLVGKQLSWVFWLFCLGAVLFTAKSFAQRGIAAGLSVALPLAFYGGDWSRIAMLVVGAQILLWVPHIEVRAFLKRPIRALSVSSYFIYMLHLIAFRGVLRLEARFQVLWFAGGVTLGIAAWMAYDAMGRRWAAWRRTHARRTPAAEARPAQGDESARMRTSTAEESALRRRA